MSHPTEAFDDRAAQLARRRRTARLLIERAKAGENVPAKTIRWALHQTGDLPVRRREHVETS